jgi:hypothetical protein
MKIKHFIAIGVLLILIFSLFWLFPIITGKYNFNTNHAAVVKEMRELNRLETASFTIEKVIEAGISTNSNIFKDFLFGDKILLIAHGEVIAGFNLSTLSDKDVVINNKQLNIILPKPEILLVRLDNDKTRVYDRQQGLLTKGDKDLEAEARLVAEKEIRTAACQSNILKEASTNARKQLTALFNALGFTTVVITIPDSSC